MTRIAFSMGPVVWTLVTQLFLSIVDAIGESQKAAA
jgi:hypothetical protein